ncbi:MAG: DegT/DnrJ/EryC1/StrS family aminotransferase, partial [Marmoricola sp.]|nr:DegT/DnrJ/EryC1/StrS family aminotransferase [Marmoricola sp.]
MESDAVRAAMLSVLAEGSWILGEAVERFEAELAAYVGLPEAVGVGNGTDALVLAFAALELPAGSRVLVAANEGGYAATAARLAGLVPTVMDVEETTMAPGVA